MIAYISNFLIAKKVVQYLFQSLKNDSIKIISLDIGASFMAIAVLALYFLFLQTIPYFLFLYFKHNDMLYLEEKKIVRWTLLTIPMGLVGSLFSFTVVKEMIIPFFMAFSVFLGLEEVIGFVQVISLTVTMAITFFLIFQIPLLIKFLTETRIVSKNNLKVKQVRLTILLVVCVVSAWITPSDIISMLMVTIPIYSTYEFGIFISSDDSNYHEVELKEILCN